MRMCIRLGTFFATWPAALLLLQGCAVETPTCSAPTGMYRPAYLPMTGNCGPIENPNWVPVGAGQNGAPVTNIMSINDSMISTEVVMKGCAMRMTQEVTTNGRLRTKIDGDSISITNASSLTGMVSISRWDELGAPACSGWYMATLTRNETTVGAGTGTPVGAGTN